MGKPIQSVLLLASALYLFSLLGSTAHAKEEAFDVEGSVYCDRCRAQFQNKLSEPISGATVRLECREPVGNQLKFSADGVTDASGNYKLKVVGDHEDEVCQVVLIQSPRQDCNEIPKEAFEQLSSRITLTDNSGIADPVRHANPLGFMVKEAVPECLQLYKELDMLPDDLVP
ncbi:hypothetical protein M9H77_26133 [Catharanthus roseus]|uniref:Uncharacterized protein n=1 Tax=Catharanthus roseus TaxID=4058 RepID=A0ACC0A8X3_CATRO|nr:hypothetical protein M9H77_26133 [Catharanthus roseus]